MLHAFSRTELLIGKAALEHLKKCKVAVFGVGGVGSYAVEALARSGVGRFVLIDDDKVCLTNINRQLIATHKTIGKPKVEVAKERILDINPKAEVEALQMFYLPENAVNLIIDDYDYIIDAIDTVTAKLSLIVRAKAKGIPIISCMGAGNKLDPTGFIVADIYDTSICPLCRAVRTQLRKLNVDSLKVVYSKEEPAARIETEDTLCGNNCVCPKGTVRKCEHRHQVPGSMAFVPSVMGLIAAGEVIKDLIKDTRYDKEDV